MCDPVILKFVRRYLQPATLMRKWKIHNFSNILSKFYEHEMLWDLSSPATFSKLNITHHAHRFVCIIRTSHAQICLKHNVGTQITATT